MKKYHYILIITVLFIFTLFTRTTSADIGPETLDLNNQLGDKAMKIAVEGSALLNDTGGDAHDAVVSTGSRKGSEYQYLYKILSQFKEEKNSEGANITYIYTMIKKGNENAIIVVDASGEGDEDKYGTKYELEPSMASAFSGVPGAARDTWLDDYYGIHKSACAPIYNSRGEISAILGVDILTPDLPIIE